MHTFPGKYRSLIEKLSHDIWAFSEVEFETPRSSQACVDVLASQGFHCTKGVGNVEHSFVAVYGSEGPRIGILVEFDALQGMSQLSGFTEAKVDPERINGHACGHNLLGSAAILGALKLKDTLLEKNLKARIEVYGCPAEESGYGKAIMADAGVFDGVDAFIAWHPNTINGLWCDQTLAVRIFEVNFKGVSSHAAGAPESGHSALDAAEMLNIGMNYYREHTPDGTRMHYAYLDAGGKAANVVQSNVKISYYLRSFSNDVLDIMESRFRDMVKGAALMSAVDYEIKETSKCKGFKPNHTIARALYETMQEYGDIDYSKKAIDQASRLSAVEGHAINSKLEAMEIGRKSTVSTDVGDVSFKAPVAQFFLACEPMGTPMHSWQWTANGKSDYAYEGIEHVSNIIEMFGLKLIVNPQIIIEAKREFEGE